jgi:cytochrome c2
MRNVGISALILVMSTLVPIQGASCQSKTSVSSAKGEKLFKSLNCTMCHSVNDAGGCMGPPLAGVTKKRSEQYLKLRLTAGKEDQFISLIRHPELFPHDRFGPAEVQSIIAYLKTLNGKPIAKAGHKIPATTANGSPNPTFTPLEPTASSREGRRLFLETGCMACHSISNTGGSLAPALDGIGARRSRSFIEAHVTNPQAHLKPVKSKMIQAELMPDQVKNITDFLLTLPKK